MYFWMAKVWEAVSHRWTRAQKVVAVSGLRRLPPRLLRFPKAKVSVSGSGDRRRRPPCPAFGVAGSDPWGLATKLLRCSVVSRPQGSEPGTQKAGQGGLRLRSPEAETETFALFEGKSLVGRPQGSVPETPKEGGTL